MTPPPPTAAARRRRGFSFIEILFAVMILGIGFIMIAGVFPVAISQTQSSGEDSTGAALARAGATFLKRLPALNQLTEKNLNGRLQHFGADNEKLTVTIARNPANGQDLKMTASMWDLVKGNMIQSEDPRFAWVGFWRRPNNINLIPESYAQIVVVAVRVRNHGVYSGTDLQPANASIPATLVPKVVNVTMSGDSQIKVDGPANAIEAVAPGAFLVLRGDANGLGAGRILKVGPKPPTGGGDNVYDLEPGADLKGPGDRPSGTSYEAYVVGRGLRPGSNSVYDGGVQDVAVYTTYVQLK